jgi:hypothetical protein
MITDDQFAYRALFDFGARWSVARGAARRRRPRRPRSGMLAALAAAGVLGSSARPLAPLR